MTDIEDTPPKKRKLDPQLHKAKKVKPNGSKRNIALAKAEAAKKRAADLFSFSPEGSSCDELSSSKLQCQLLEQKKKIEQLQGQLAQKGMFDVYVAIRPLMFAWIDVR